MKFSMNAVCSWRWRSVKLGSISEPATLTLVVGTQRYTRVLKKAKTTQFWLRKKPAAYRLIATDAAGNSAFVRYRR